MLTRTQPDLLHSHILCPRARVPERPVIAVMSGTLPSTGSAPVSRSVFIGVLIHTSQIALLSRLLWPLHRAPLEHRPSRACPSQPRLGRASYRPSTLGIPDLSRLRLSALRQGSNHSSTAPGFPWTWTRRRGGSSVGTVLWTRGLTTPFPLRRHILVVPMITQYSSF